MEINLKNTSMRCYETQYSADLTDDETMETVVPDIMPDIREILFADGMVFLREKECVNGRMSVAGTVKTYILYIPEEETSVQKLELDIPFQLSADSDRISERCFCVSEIRIRSIDARIINSRKAGVRLSLIAQMRCYLQSENALTSLPDDGSAADIHIKQLSVPFDVIADVREKSFVLTDEYPIAGRSSPADELIGQHAELFTEEVKKVGTKLIFKGIVKTNLIWKCEDGTLGSDSFSSGFSQIIETDSAEESTDSRISLILNGAYYEMLYISNTDRRVSAQLNILAQSVSMEQKTANIIADAYSNQYPLSLINAEKANFCTSQTLVLRDNMRGVIELSEPMRDVVQTSVKVGSWIQTDTGFKCPMMVSLLLRTEDAVFQSVDRSFTAEWSVTDTDAQGFDIQSAECSEISAMPTAGGVEVKMLAVARVIKTDSTVTSPVISITADTEHPLDLSAIPSVTVLPQKCNDLWALAKRYHSTEEMIAAANESVACSVMLIPKAR